MKLIYPKITVTCNRESVLKLPWKQSHNFQPALKQFHKSFMNEKCLQDSRKAIHHAYSMLLFADYNVTCPQRRKGKEEAVVQGMCYLHVTQGHHNLCTYINWLTSFMIPKQHQCHSGTLQINFNHMRLFNMHSRHSTHFLHSAPIKMMPP